MSKKVLSKKHGGEADTKTYCTYFQKRPYSLDDCILCNGDDYWKPCADFAVCSKNDPPPLKKISSPMEKIMVDFYTLMSEVNTIMKGVTSG
jgi:hypothetical protein